MAYSLDFRQKVLKVRDAEGLSMAQVAKRFGICLATVMNWSKDIVPKKTRNKPATKIDMEALRQDVEAHPDAYTYERANRLGASKNGIWYALRRLGVTYKKKSAAPAFRPRRTACLPRDPESLRR